VCKYIEIEPACQIAQNCMWPRVSYDCSPSEHQEKRA
jgi:hypothetical protein